MKLELSATKDELANCRSLLSTAERELERTKEDLAMEKELSLDTVTQNEELLKRLGRLF
jgi:hypothetical protein